MSKLKHYVKRGLGLAALSLFLVVAVMWAYIFIRDPKLAGGWNKAIVPVLELIFLGAIGGFFKKQFMRYAQETKNASAALVKLVGDEWIIQLSIWAIILITALHVVLTMPVYKVVVTIQPSADVFAGPHDFRPSLSLSDLLRGIPVKMEHPVDQPFQVLLTMEDSEDSLSLGRPDTSRLQFESRRYLRYGQKSSIMVKAEERIKISVRTQPPSPGTKIEVSAPPHYDTLDGEGDFTIEKGSVLQLLVTANGYKAEPRIYDDLNENTTIVVAYADKISSIPEPSDSNTRVIELNPLSGTVSFEIFNEGGERIENMTVYISKDGMLLTSKSCRYPFTLDPGEYWVSIKEEVEAGSEDYAEVKRFPVSISSGQNAVVKCTTELH
jgi:hypothetical protein